MPDVLRSTKFLRHTPALLRELLLPLHDELLHVTEGPGTWSPYQVLAHMTWGEVDDWIPRARIVLEHGEALPFTPFDRLGGQKQFAGWEVSRLLDEFARLRAENMDTLDGMHLRPLDLRRTGQHPALGIVSLSQLLSCWVAHDMAHILQITRVLLKAHGPHIGPWREFFSVLKEQDAERALQ
jgi:hypothetical protein